MKFSPRTWVLLGILYIAFILYSTLLPFNFSVEVFQSNLGNIEWFKHHGHPFYITRNFDAIANIFFFIPLGIIFYNTRYAFGRKRRIIVDLGLATFAGFILSLSIELMQLLSEERTTSLVDVLMNSTGSLIGAIIARIFTCTFNYSNRIKIKSFIRKLPSELYLIPFIIISFLISGNTYVNFLKSDKIENIYFSWNYIIRPSWIWLVLYVYIPTSLLIAHTINKYLNFSLKYLYYILSFLSCLIILGTIELIKFSGNIDLIPPGNTIAGIIGVMIGIIVYDILSGETSKGVSHGGLKTQYILSVIFLFLASLILYKSAYPLNFNLSQEYLLKKSAYSLLSTNSFIPFSGFINLFIYTIQAILLFLPIGIILNEMECHLRLKKHIYLLVLPCILLILFSFVVKIINENQIPLLLEVPINVLGIFCGYFFWYGFRKSV